PTISSSDSATWTSQRVRDGGLRTVTSCSVIAVISSSGGWVELESAAGVASGGGGQGVAGGEAQRERRLAGQLLAAGLGCDQALSDAAAREGIGAGHHGPGGVALDPQVASCLRLLGGQLD